MSYRDQCRHRIQDAVDDIENNRILEYEDAMAWEAGKINDGDLVDNENVDDEREGDNNAFQILLVMTAHGEAWLAKQFFGFHVFFACSVTLMRCVTLKFCTY